MPHRRRGILKEGNDCNEDGEYAERSAGNYNRINNDAMIMLAVATGDESYYAPVLRNLEMMLTYIDPDDSIFTNNSTAGTWARKFTAGILPRVPLHGLYLPQARTAGRRQRHYADGGAPRPAQL